MKAWTDDGGPLYLLGADGVSWIVLSGQRLTPYLARCMAEHIQTEQPARAERLRDLADRAEAASFVPHYIHPNDPTNQIEVPLD